MYVLGVCALDMCGMYVHVFVCICEFVYGVPLCEVRECILYACFGVRMLHFASVGQTDAGSEDGEHEESRSTCESVEVTHR